MSPTSPWKTAITSRAQKFGYAQEAHFLHFHEVKEGKIMKAGNSFANEGVTLEHVYSHHAVRTANPPAKLGAIAAGACGPSGLFEPDAYLPLRTRQARPRIRDRACL